MCFKFHIIEAINLPAVDSNGKSDPYIKIYSISENKYKIGRTKTIKKTLDPVWNEFFFFNGLRTDELYFELFDYDFLSSDDYLGKCSLKISEQPFNT